MWVLLGASLPIAAAELRRAFIIRELRIQRARVGQPS